MAHGRKTGGRMAGTPNKATSSAREAIRQLLDVKMQSLGGWLDSTANGIKVVKVAADGTQYDEYLVKPNPAKAFELLHSLLEFSVPKLTRMQVSNEESNPMELEHNLNVFGKLLESIKSQRQAEP
jgi:hypothetical protein